MRFMLDGEPIQSLIFSDDEEETRRKMREELECVQKWKERKAREEAMNRPVGFMETVRPRSSSLYLTKEAAEWERRWNMDCDNQLRPHRL